MWSKGRPPALLLALALTCWLAPAASASELIARDAQGVKRGPRARTRARHLPRRRHDETRPRLGRSERDRDHESAAAGPIPSRLLRRLGVLPPRILEGVPEPLPAGTSPARVGSSRRAVPLRAATGRCRAGSARCPTMA